MQQNVFPIPNTHNRSKVSLLLSLREPRVPAATADEAETPDAVVRTDPPVDRVGLGSPVGMDHPDRPDDRDNEVGGPWDGFMFRLEGIRGLELLRSNSLRMRSVYQREELWAQFQNASHILHISWEQWVNPMQRPNIQMFPDVRKTVAAIYSAIRYRQVLIFPKSSSSPTPISSFSLLTLSHLF